VLGLELDQVDKDQAIPARILELVEARRAARAAKNWTESDRLRDEIQARGYTVKDTREGMQLLKA
jgi:cysteinyl-tRNA synthetase